MPTNETVFVVLLILIIMAITKVRAILSIYWKFGVNPLFYRIKHTDVGGKTYKGISNNLYIGKPDVIFIHRFFNTIIVGEFKSRKYNGYFRYYEFIQLQIYLGILDKKINKSSNYTAVGILAYKDYARRFSFNGGLYEALKEYSPEDKGRVQPIQVKHKTLFQGMDVNFVL